MARCGPPAEAIDIKHRRMHALNQNTQKVVEPSSPSAAAGPGGVMQTFENVSNFLNALAALGFAGSSLFCVPDLESDGWEERCVRARRVGRGVC